MYTHVSAALLFDLLIASAYELYNKATVRRAYLACNEPARTVLGLSLGVAMADYVIHGMTPARLLDDLLTLHCSLYAFSIYRAHWKHPLTVVFVLWSIWHYYG
jgi:hypothetical protein